MGVRVGSVSLIVSGEPAREGDATDLRRMADELIVDGVDELSVDLSGAGGRPGQTAALLTVLVDVDSRMRAAGGRCRLIGVSTPVLIAALAEAPLEHVFAIYAAVRNGSRTDRSRSDRGVPARSIPSPRSVAPAGEPGDLAPR